MGLTTAKQHIRAWESWSKVLSSMHQVAIYKAGRRKSCIPLFADVVDVGLCRRGWLHRRNHEPLWSPWSMLGSRSLRVRIWFLRPDVLRGTRCRIPTSRELTEAETLPAANIRGGSAVVQMEKEQWFGQGWKDACWAVGWLPNKAKERGALVWAWLRKERRWRNEREKSKILLLNLEFHIFFKANTFYSMALSIPCTDKLLVKKMLIYLSICQL